MSSDAPCCFSAFSKPKSASCRGANSSLSASSAEKDAARALKQTSLLDTRTESSATSSSLIKNSIVRIEVSQDGRPLVGASVYMSRARDNRVRELGKTSAAGLVDSRTSLEFFGETITVFHECCAPKSFAAKFNKQKDLESIKVDLTSGAGSVSYTHLTLPTNREV